MQPFKQNNTEELIRSLAQHLAIPGVSDMLGKVLQQHQSKLGGAMDGVLGGVGAAMGNVGAVGGIGKGVSMNPGFNDSQMIMSPERQAMINAMRSGAVQGGIGRGMLKRPPQVYGGANRMMGMQ